MISGCGICTGRPGLPFSTVMTTKYLRSSRTAQGKDNERNFGQAENQ
jgi:hypothetical protein